MTSANIVSLRFYFPTDSLGYCVEIAQRLQGLAHSRLVHCSLHLASGLLVDQTRDTVTIGYAPPPLHHGSFIEVFVPTPYSDLELHCRAIQSYNRGGVSCSRLLADTLGLDYDLYFYPANLYRYAVRTATDSRE